MLRPSPLQPCRRACPCSPPFTALQNAHPAIRRIHPASTALSARPDTRHRHQAPRHLISTRQSGEGSILSFPFNAHPFAHAHQRFDRRRQYRHRGHLEQLGHTRRKAVAVDCTDLEAVEPHRLRMVFTLSNALPEAVVHPADLVLRTNGTRIPGNRLWRPRRSSAGNARRCHCSPGPGARSDPRRCD